MREIVVRRLTALSGETWTSLAAFLDGCESAEMQNLITEAVTEGRPIPNPEQQLADVVLRLRNQHLDRQIAALDQRVSQPATSDAERVEILREQQRLKQLKRQPLAAGCVSELTLTEKARTDDGPRLFGKMSLVYFAPWSIHARISPTCSGVSAGMLALLFLGGIQSSSPLMWATLWTSMLSALLPGLMTLPSSPPLSAPARLSRRNLAFWVSPRRGT